MSAKRSTLACSAAGCWKPGQRRQLTLGTHCVFLVYCRSHFDELTRLRRSQGKDWGSSIRRGFDARLYYAAKKGFHAY